MSKKRSHKMEKLARIYDDEILPVWAQPFARMLLRGLVIAERSQILDVACGTGYITVEILRRMGTGCRLIAIDASSALLDVARRKVERMGSREVFFRTENPEPRLSFADDVYDLLVSNLGLFEMGDVGRALADFTRVVRVGGQLRCTLPLAGTFQELYDIYREVLIKHDKHEILARVDEHIGNYATPEVCDIWMKNAGLGDIQIEVEEFSMLFKSSREFFFAPVIEHGPLATWKELAGQGQEMQDIFWYIKEAIDAYFSGRAFEVTVRGALLVGSKLEIDPAQAGPDQPGSQTSQSSPDIPDGRRDTPGFVPSGSSGHYSVELMIEDSLIESEATDPSAALADHLASHAARPAGQADQADQAGHAGHASPPGKMSDTTPGKALYQATYPNTGTKEIDIAEMEEIDPDEDIALDRRAIPTERTDEPRHDEEE